MIMITACVRYCYVCWSMYSAQQLGSWVLHDGLCVFLSLILSLPCLTVNSDCW